MWLTRVGAHGCVPACSQLHASWADLFHDLIYVGAAYQLGDVVKTSFYSCVTEEELWSERGNSSGSSPSSGPLSSGRRLGLPAAEGGAYECVGVLIGVFYSMALFQCLVRLWMADLFLHNRFEASDMAHRLHDCLTYLAIAFAASGILPVAGFLEVGPYSFDVPLLGSIQYVEQCLSNLDFNAGYGPCETYHQNATNSTNFYYCVDDGACGQCCECVSECDPASKPPYASSSGGHINGSFNSITLTGTNFGSYHASSRVKIGGTYSPTIKWTSGMLT